MIASNVQYFPRPAGEARAMARIVLTVFVGGLLGALIGLVFAAPTQPSAVLRCESGHDPLAESCLASGAIPRMRPLRGFKARKSASLQAQ